MTDTIYCGLLIITQSYEHAIVSHTKTILFPHFPI